MKDNEINRAKCGCALEPSHLNIQACVSSLHSRDFRTQLAPIKRYDTGERAVTPLGCCLSPAPCTGLRQESCISMEHSPPGHLQYGPAHLILLCSSCRALCTSQAQTCAVSGCAWYSRQSSSWKHKWFLNHLLQSVLSRAATTAAPTPTQSQLSFSSLLPLANPHRPPC